MEVGVLEVVAWKAIFLAQPHTTRIADADLRYGSKRMLSYYCHTMSIYIRMETNHHGTGAQAELDHCIYKVLDPVICCWRKVSRSGGGNLVVMHN